MRGKRSDVGIGLNGVKDDRKVGEKLMNQSVALVGRRVNLDIAEFAVDSRIDDGGIHGGDKAGIKQAGSQTDRRCSNNDEAPSFVSPDILPCQNEHHHFIPPRPWIAETGLIFLMKSRGYNDETSAMTKTMIVCE